MKSFKSIVMSRQPWDRLWVTIRDRMPELAEMLDDIERITVLNRHELRNNRIQLVNEWRAKPRLPISLKPVIGSDSLIWLDFAEWIESEQRCCWRIEPQFLVGRIRCDGATCYEPAMGGRGSRITFEGKLDLDEGMPSGVGRLLQGGVAQIVESVVTAMIPRNFRRVVEAAGQILDSGYAREKKLGLTNRRRKAI